MKKTMLFLAFFIATLFSNCAEEVKTYQASGEITGPNPMACPTICCSGWFIDIDGESYHFLTFPADSDLSAEDIDDYPFSVQLDYEISEECWDNSIEILAIEAL